MTECSGRVFVVGAGPGDPSLITVKGLQLLREADVILYDRLVPGELLKEAKPSAEKIYVGKAPGAHTYTQEEINKMLLNLALKGKTVVRLHGGDPYVFGRGEEECAFLLSNGVCCEVVPGVTSALAAPAYAGIPVTSRGISSSFAVVTGRVAPGSSKTIRYSEIARAVDTLIILMGVSELENIVADLLAGGADPSTPVAIVERGTTSSQRVIVGELKNIVELARRERVSPPAVVVVGNVVKLREKLWKLA
ncbi:MAG: uroporphyrinogen-III C-methyltransferase [Thermoproteota archaeon]